MQINIKAAIGAQVICVPFEVEPDRPMKSVIIEFCQKIDIPITNNIQMKDDTGLMLNKEGSVSEAGIHNGDTVFILQSGHGDDGISEGNSVRIQEGKERQGNCNVLVLVIGFVLVTGSVCGVIGLTMKFTEEICLDEGYGAVFDAGSSHTNLTIYSWPRKSIIAGTGTVTQEGTCRAPGGGISSYEDTTREAGPSLTTCLEYIGDIVPEDYLSYTYLSLGATAGMRLLDKTQPAASKAIMTSVRETMATYSFNFSSDQASIISGEDEGTYGWVSANFLAGTLQPTSSFRDTFFPSILPDTNSTTFGAMDLGGASTQMTFVPEDPSSLPPGYSKHLRLYGIDYTLYTHSYLCYGINEAIRRFKANLVKDANYSTIVTNPCAPKGFSETIDSKYLWKAPCSTGPQALAGWGSEVTPPFWAENSTTFNLTGESDLERCQEAVETLFNFAAPCLVKPCSFNGIYQPKPVGNFFAFSTFEKLISGLGLPSAATIEEIDNATSSLCAKTYDEIKKMHGNVEYLVLYCFEINFVSTLLLQGYGFDQDNWKITFTGKVKGQELGWSLGFMTTATNMIPTEATCSDFSRVGFYVGIGLLSVSFIIGLIVLAYSIYRCTTQKPQGGYQELNTDYEQNTRAPYGSV